MTSTCVSIRRRCGVDSKALPYREVQFSLVILRSSRSINVEGLELSKMTIERSGNFSTWEELAWEHSERIVRKDVNVATEEASQSQRRSGGSIESQPLDPTGASLVENGG